MRLLIRACAPACEFTRAWTERRFSGACHVVDE
jgi:hypothetical protein